MQTTMFRETRHLWVGNLPENIREERLIDYFKRYGKVQSVRIFPKSTTTVTSVCGGTENSNPQNRDSNSSNGTNSTIGTGTTTTNGPNCTTNGSLCNGVSATVAFIDIKSAAKAHSSENKIEERTLKTDYYEPHRHHDDQHSTVVSNKLSSHSSSTTSSTTSNQNSSTVINAAASSSTSASSGSAAVSSTSSSTAVATSSSTVAPASSSTPSSSSSSNNSNSHCNNISTTIANNNNSTGSGPTTNVLAAATSSGTVSSTTSATSAVAAASSSSTSSSSSPATSLSSNASTVYGRHTPIRYNSNSSSTTLPHESSVNNSNSVQASSTHHGSSSLTTTTATSGGHQNFPGVASPQDDHLSIASSNDPEESRQATTAICVRKLSHRLTDSNIKESLFYEFKRYGKVVNTYIRGQGSDRYAIVVFSKPEEVDKALKDSKDKQLLGSRVDITPCDNSDLVDDSKSNDPDSDHDFCHPRATRTLWVGNLDKEVNSSDLYSKFSQFGTILEIDIKNQNQPYAFIRYNDISSVVKAMKKYNNEQGSSKLKLGFGKSFLSGCIYIGDYKDAFSDLKATEKYLNKYGPVQKIVSDYEQKAALCFFESPDEAKKAIEELKLKIFNGRKVIVEFASRDFQAYFMEKKSQKPDESHRGRLGSWISANSVDYEDNRSYDRNRSTSSYHHHQLSSRSSSSSLSCQVRSNNNSVSSSYSLRQRSQSPTSPPDNQTFNSFNSRHSLSQSSVHSGNTNRISKYEYHHESSNSCRSSRYNRYGSPGDDVEDVDDESHLSSSSKRDSRSYRSHHLSENFLSDASPKIRRDSSPYSSSYSNSSMKLDSDFHRSNRTSASQNDDNSKSHDDGHSGSLLRRANHSSSKLYHKSGRDSPTAHVSQYKKSGLSSSSSSSNSSSNSRSPIRDVNKSTSSHYQDRTSVSPPTSPRSSQYSYHESERQTTHSTSNDANVDHSQWRRKSTEENNCHRDHSSLVNSDLQRVRSESVSDASDSCNNFSALNSHRDHGRDYFRDRFRESHHRTNSITSSSSTLAYQNRNDSIIKRKYSSLETDDNSSDLPGHLERKKRLMACIEQSSNSLSTNASNVTSQSGSLSATSAATNANSLINKSNSTEQRITSSKSVDSSESTKPHSQKSRDLTNVDLLARRRLSNSSSTGNNSSHPLQNNDTNNVGSGSNVNSSFNDLKPIFEQYLAEGNLNAKQAAAMLTLLNPTSDQSKLLPLNRNCNVAGQTSSTNTSSSSNIVTSKPKTKDNCQTLSLRFTDCASSLVNYSLSDPRLSGHNIRKSLSRITCDNDLNKNPKPESSSNSSSLSKSFEYGPSSPMNLPLPDFAIPQVKSISGDSKCHQTANVITSSTTATTTTLTSSLSNTSAATTTTSTASGANLTHIPNLTSSSPKNASIMSPLGNLSPVPKNRLSRDRALSTDTNSFDFKTRTSNDLDDVSDSDIGTLMFEDKIKYNAWLGTNTTPTLKSEKTPTIDYSKYNIKKKSQTNSNSNSTSAFPSSNTNDSESTDIIKNILSSKSSVFDQDSKRLEHLNEKYEPKDVSSSTLDLDSIGSHKILSRSKFPNAIQSSLVLPTDKIQSSLDSLPKMTSTSSSTTTPNALSSSSFHYNHHHHHPSSFSLSNTTSIPTSSSSITSSSRKFPDSVRTNQIKKEYLSSTSLSSAPNTPGSAPVRSTATMFPQFSRSASVSTASSTPNTPTLSSTLANRSSFHNTVSSNRKESSAATNLTINSSANQSTRPSDSSMKHKLDPMNKSIPPHRSLDGMNKIASNNTPCKSDHQTSLIKREQQHSLNKLNVPECHRAKHDAFNKKESERKNSSSTSDHVLSNMMTVNDNVQSLKDHLKSKSNEISLKHSTKESSKEENKDQRKIDKTEKSRDRCEISSPPVSKEKEKTKIDKKNEAILSKEKDRDKIKKKAKEKEYSSIKEKSEKEKEQQQNKQRSKMPDKNKDKIKNCEKEIRKKDKHKDKKKNEENKSKLLSEPFDDEPIYFSMYDKVKARSSANQSLKVAKTSDHLDSVRQKLSQLKDKRQHRKDDDKNKSTEDSEDDSDSSFDGKNLKQKKLLKKRRAVVKSDSSSDEEFSNSSKSHNKKSSKKLSINDEDSNSMDDHHNKDSKKQKPNKKEPIGKYFSEDEVSSDDETSISNAKQKNNRMKANKMAEICSDESSEDSLTKLVKRKKKLKKDKEKERFVESSTEKEKSKQDKQLHESDKSKDLSKFKKNKNDKKEINEKVLKNEKEKAQRSCSKSDEEGEFMQKMLKKMKKKKKSKSSKEKHHSSPTKENKLKNEIFSDDEEESSDDDHSMVSKKRQQHSNSHIKFPDLTNSDSESQSSTTHLFKSCKEEIKQDQRINNISKKLDKQQNQMVNKSKTEVDKFKDERLAKNKKNSIFNNFQMNENKKFEDDSSKESIKKKKKSSKNKEKVRKDSVSNDSSDKTSQSSSFDQRHCKFNDLNLFRLTSPESNMNDGRSNLLEPKSAMLIPSPPPKTPEISSPRSSPSYVENIIISQVDEDSSYIDSSKIDEDLINESQTILQQQLQHENSSSDSCLSDSLVPDSSPPGHSNDYSISITVQTSLVGQLVTTVPENGDHSSKSLSPFEQKHRSYEEEATIQSIKLQKELDTTDTKCTDPTKPILPLTFPHFETSTSEKPSIENLGLSFTSTIPVVVKTEDDQSTIFVENVEVEEQKVIVVEDQKEFNSELECQRKIEDDLAVAALLQDMNDPCVIEEPTTQTDDIEPSPTHHEIPLPTFINIITPVDESVLSDDRSEPTTVDSVVVTTTEQTVVVVDDQELKAAVQEIEFVATQETKEETIKPVVPTITIESVTEMFDDENVENELVVDETTDLELDKSLEDLSEMDIPDQESQTIDSTVVNEMAPFPPTDKSPSNSIDDLSHNTSVIMEVETTNIEVEPQEMPHQTIDPSPNEIDENITIEKPSDEATITSPLSMPILTDLEEQNEVTTITTVTFENIFTSPTGQDVVDQPEVLPVKESVSIEIESDQETQRRSSAEQENYAPIETSPIPNENVEKKAEDIPMINESKNKRPLEELEIDTNENQSRPKRGRKSKNRKNSDSSMHSPRSEQGNICNQSTGATLPTLLVNTNLPALLSPTSQSPVTTSYSEISPGSQTKRGKQSQSHGYSYAIRRSGRHAAHAASAANNTALEELEETDYSVDEPAPKEEHDDETKNGVRKPSKRGRKKKVAANVETFKVEDSHKKPFLGFTINNTITTSTPARPTFDIFEFVDEEEEDPLSKPTLRSLPSADKHHSEKRHQIENVITENDLNAGTSKPETTLTINDESAYGSTSNLNCPKEYVSEVNQSGKLVIRLQEPGVGIDGKAKEEIKAVEEPVPPSNESSSTTFKGIRKSARLMSQGTKLATDETSEESSLKSKQTSESEKGTCKRVTRSNRKSDDTQHQANDSSDEQDESSIKSSRSYRITRSRGSINQEQVSDIPAPKKSETIEEQSQPITQEPPAPIEIAPVVAETPTESIPVNVPTSVPDQTNIASVINVAVPQEPKKSESLSVIQSTGNVEKIVPVPVVVATTIPTPTAMVTSPSASITSANVPVITTTPSVVVCSPSVITSPSSICLQDIPNISERIHQSATPLKLKTGKGLVFEDFKAPPIITAAVPSDNNAAVVAPKLPEPQITPQLVTNQPVMIKPKYQHPVGQQAAEIKPRSKSPASISLPSVNEQVKTSLPETSPLPLVMSVAPHTTSKLPPSVTPPSMNESMKNLNIAITTQNTSVPLASTPKPFVSHTKSVLQVTGNNAQSQELNISYPPNLIPTGSHLASTIPNSDVYLQSQSKDYLNPLQKQQQPPPSQQQPPIIVTPHSLPSENNRSAKPDHIAEYMPPNLNNSELPQTGVPVNNHVIAPPHPPFGAIRPPVSAANSMMNQPIPLSGFEYGHLWSTYPQALRQIPLGPRFIYPTGFPQCLPPGLNPEQIAEQQAQQKSKSQKEDSHPPFGDGIKLHPGQEKTPFPLDMANLNASQRNQINPAILPPNPYSQMIPPPHDRYPSNEAAYLQYGMNGQGRIPSVPIINYQSNPNTDLSKQLPSQSPTLDPKRPPSKPAAGVQDSVYPAGTQRPLPSPAHSPAYRKELAATLPESNQIPHQFIKDQQSNSPPLNMSFQRANSPNLPQPLSRPSSVCSVPEQAASLAKRTTPPVHNTSPAPIMPQNPQQILERHPVLWQGLLALKNDQAAVQMHYVSGNKTLASQALPYNEHNASSLRITQRMRFEPSQLNGLVKKIHAKDEYCILMALPCGRDQVDVLQSSNNLKKYFITYLQSKCAAGIVNDSSYGYITHIFPPCEFSEEHLVRTAPEMLHNLLGISHLMVVITTTDNARPTTSNAIPSAINANYS